MTPDEIKALRARLGLSLAEFAGRLGVGERTARYWEDGERKPSKAAALLMGQLAAIAARAKAPTKAKATKRKGDSR